MFSLSKKKSQIRKILHGCIRSTLLECIHLEIFFIYFVFVEIYIFLYIMNTFIRTYYYIKKPSLILLVLLKYTIYYCYSFESARYIEK